MQVKNILSYFKMAAPTTSSRFLPQGRRIVGSGDENGLNAEKEKKTNSKPKTKPKLTVWVINNNMLHNVYN